MESPKSHQHQHQTSTATAPQIRSRITVVCAECKRLKLKCDRRNPCGSCTKRDTVARCVYSPAAAEKVDLHSLNNRLIQVEATLNQLTASLPLSPAFNSRPSGNGSGSGGSGSGSCERVGYPGSALSISLEDLAAWLDQLDVDKSIYISFNISSTSNSTSMSPTSLSLVRSHPTLASPFSSPNSIKLEPAHVYLPFKPDTEQDMATTLLLPPLSVYHNPTLSSSHHHHHHHSSSSPTTTTATATTTSSASSSHSPISPALLALLPPQNHHAILLDILHPILLLRPSFNWHHFRNRIDSLFDASRTHSTDGGPWDPRGSSSLNGNGSHGTARTKAQSAREILFGTSSSSSSSSPPRTSRLLQIRSPPGFSSNSNSNSHHQHRPQATPPAISFFAATAAAFALGSLVSGKRPEVGVEMWDGGDGVVGGRQQKGGSSSGSGMGAGSGSGEGEGIGSGGWASGSEGTSGGGSRDAGSDVDEMAVDDGMRGVGNGGAGGAGRPQSQQRRRRLWLKKESSPAYLYALSAQALSVHETNGAPFDLDYLVACILQVLYLLLGRGGAAGVADGVGSGNKGVGGALFPLVGKMVNIARQMGLSADPDEVPGRYSLFEAETRRRVWWEVFYYDLFVSDCMGHPPLIPDGSYTARMPADVDEHAFSPGSSVLPRLDTLVHGRGSGSGDRGGRGGGRNAGGFKYFELKCQLAQLVRIVKRRTNANELGYNVDQAAGIEAEVQSWLSGLPEEWRLGMNAKTAAGEADEDVTSWTTTSTPTMILAAQRCELSIAAHRLILKLYVPFLRGAGGSGNNNGGSVPHQAAHGTVNAAHAILHACKVLRALWERHSRLVGLSDSGSGSGRERLGVLDVSSRSGGGVMPVPVPMPMPMPVPAIFDFYSFERVVLDAAVVCGHAAIKQPSAVWAGVALDDVGAALEVLGDGSGVRRTCAGVGVGVEGEVPLSEAVGIVEALKKKGEAARCGGSGGVGSGSGSGTAGTKRKHGEVEGGIPEGVVVGGFQFPFVVEPPVATSTAGTETRERSQSVVSPTVSHRQHHQQQQHRLSDADSRSSATVDLSSERTRMQPETVKSPQLASRVANDGDGKDRDKEKEKEKKKHARKTHYPPVGVRVRPPRDGSPLLPQRPGSGETTRSNSSDGTMQAPTVRTPLQQSLAGVPKTPVLSSPRLTSGELAFQQQQERQRQHLQRKTQMNQDGMYSGPQSSPQEVRMPSQQAPPNNSHIVEAAGGDYSLPFGSGEGTQMGVDGTTQRRRFSIHELGQNSQTHLHHQHPQHHHHQPYQGYANTHDTPTSVYSQHHHHHQFEQNRTVVPYDKSRATSFDPSHTHPLPNSRATSFAPSSSPYGNASGPSPHSQPPPPPVDTSSMFSGTSGGNGSSNYGPGPGLASHLPSPSHFGAAAARPHTTAPAYAPPQPPPPGAHGLYMPTGYDSQFSGGTMHEHHQHQHQHHAPSGMSLGLGGMTTPSPAMDSLGGMTSSVPSTPLYDKSHQSVYSMKPPDQQHHHGETIQQPYHVDHTHNASQNHALSLTSSQSSWSQTNSGEFWTEGYY